MYEQNCQVCHGPDLKGDRGPAINSAVSRMIGADAARAAVTSGKGSMPAITGVTPQLMGNLIAFLTKPDAAPAGTAAPAAALAMAGGANRLIRRESRRRRRVTGPYGNESRRLGVRSPLTI